MQAQIAQIIKKSKKRKLRKKK